MNNPYRARSSRAKVDHPAISGYGSQNQNSWNSMPVDGRTAVPSANVYRPQPNSMIQAQQQQPQPQDPWEWGTDNGNNGNNDSWNWSIDQKSEVKQQHSQPHQFPPSGQTNNSQTAHNPQSDIYYQNVNRNVRSVLNQRPPSVGNTTRNSLSRESTPNNKDGYNQYAPYDYNQQPQQQYHNLPPRPNSKSSPALPDQSQWSANGQQAQSLPHIGHNPVPAPQPEIVNKLQTPPLLPQANNYNWQQMTPSPQNNWQNHGEAPVSGTWQDPSKQQPVDNVNQWQQAPQAFTPREFASPGSDHANWNNQPQQQPNQWPSNYSYGASSESASAVQPNSVNANSQWHQPMFNPTGVEEQVGLKTPPMPSQQWQQPPARHETVPANDWAPSPRPVEFGASENDSPLANHQRQNSIEANEGHRSLNDWQQTQPPLSHFAPPNGAEKIVSPQDQGERKRSVGVNEALHTRHHVIERKSSDEAHWPEPEAQATQSNPENVVSAQNNTETDWTTSDEWNTIPTSELSSGLSQLSISSHSNRQLENQNLQSDMHSSIHSADGWSSQAVSGSLSEIPMDNQSHDSLHQASQFVPPLQPDNNTVQEVAPPNAGYDQWYAQRNTSAQPDNNWYRNDSQSKSQKWTTPEQNIENYENVQQPAEFVNSEVVPPVMQKRNHYGSHDSINRETLDNEPKTNAQAKDNVTPRDFQEDINNVEVPSLHQAQQVEQAPDNYEFASNDRNTFLETGELTDSHQQHEPTPPSQEDENDEVPSDIPFLREVPGQSSSSSDPRRNDPTGQEQNVQLGPRSSLSDPRRNDPSGQEQTVQPVRNIPERQERRDVPPGQERSAPLPPRIDPELPERRNDPSGRERSLPPPQSRNDTAADNRRNLTEIRRNDPSGEECLQPQPSVAQPPAPTDLREVPGRGIENEEPIQQVDSGLRQIPGGASPSEEIQISSDREDARVVTGSREAAAPIPPSAKHDQSIETRIKREEAVGASLGEDQGGATQINRRDSYEEGDDKGSGNSRDESRERRREKSPGRRGYDYERNSKYYDRERDFNEDYYYESRRGADYERAYNSREDLDRRDVSFRDDDRRHTSRDDLDRRGRDKEDPDRRGRRDGKDDLDDRRRREDERRKGRGDVDHDPRYYRDREFSERDRKREPERRGRRYEDYDPRDQYRRDYYEDPYTRNSRPSSRSSYNDRDRDFYTRTRDPYYGYNGTKAYGGGYPDYGANYGPNYYAYLENLRRTNPAAYAEWYHRYYASQHHQSQAVRGNYQEDRASVHSGRSSCDERTTGDKCTLPDASMLEDTTIGSSRMTPTKFSTSHVQARFSTGSLVHVHASYPADGELARVDVLRVSSLLAHDPVVRELVAYPGPLIKQVGVTHKKTIIEYCEAKIKKAEYIEDVDDPSSYILLYELMVMLIRQNGNVVGVDIAELLLSNQKSYPYAGRLLQAQTRRESIISQKSLANSRDDIDRDTATPLDTDEAAILNKPLSIDQVTDQFRELLLYGCGQEALEYAMNNGLWGHALFLASKLDKRTHASVMTRFANGLTANDPLQTLYQLQSGRVPASVTCVAEQKWGDWRPHLAMIISNTSPNPEINRKSITTLGDTLIGRGHIHAAHFCYILAQVDFGPYGVPASKLVLLGSNPQKSYNEFVTNEAIMLTEIYEYARNLSEPGFTLIDLQTFKYGLAVKMVDYGLTEKALLYIEQIAVNITREPSKYEVSFVQRVHNLGDRIKYNDPVCKDSNEDAANLTWLNNLSEIVGKFQMGEIIQDGIYDSKNAPDPGSFNQHQEQQDVQQPQQQWVVAQPDYSDGPTSLMEQPTADVQRDWQPMSLPSTIQDSYTSNNQYSENSMDAGQQQQQQSQMDYWGQQGYAQAEYTAPVYQQTEWQQNSEQHNYQSEQPDGDNNQQQEWNYEPHPTISMGPSTNKQYDPLAELDALDPPAGGSKSSGESKKSSEKQQDKKNGNGGGSWFGGFFSKLALKPKNQMILPDDNNPTIVWDAVHKKWTNKDADGEGSSGALAPPPKATDMSFRLPQSESMPPSMTMQPQSEQQGQLDEASNNNIHKLPTGNNMFKMPKGSRSSRTNYIDVMNPGGQKTGGPLPSVTPPVTALPIPNATSSPQFFIPAPVNDPGAPVDFLTSASVANGDNTQQGGPMMFNPTDVKDSASKRAPRSRYPPR